MPHRLQSARLFAPFVVALALLATTDGCSGRAPETGAPVVAGAFDPGLGAYRDPVTGAFGPRPSGAGLPSRPGLGGAKGPLQESAAPGGGRMVRLNGSFRSHVTAAVGPDGSHVSCAVAPR